VHRFLEVAGGDFKLPRQTGMAGAQWLPETGPGTAADQQFDSITFTPSRIMGRTLVGSQLLKQSSVDIETFVANDLARSIAVSVDAATLYGTGTNQPLGILNYGANTSGNYGYNLRSAPVTFGGAPSWQSVLQFELALEMGLVENDGTFAFVSSPAVRNLWQQTPVVANFGRFLWEQESGEQDGTVNGRRAVSSTQIQNNTVLLGRWSDCIIAQWMAVDVVSNIFAYATTAEVEITANVLAAIQFKYALSFCSSTDAGNQ
jgi:HK97 family phage major capsid protein